MNKKGVSEVVANVLIVLLLIVGIAVIWFVVKPTIDKGVINNSQNDTNNNTLNNTFINNSIKFGKLNILKSEPFWFYSTAYGTPFISLQESYSQKICLIDKKNEYCWDAPQDNEEVIRILSKYRPEGVQK